MRLLILWAGIHADDSPLFQLDSQNNGLTAHLAVLDIFLLRHGRVDADIQRLPTVGTLNQDGFQSRHARPQNCCLAIQGMIRSKASSIRSQVVEKLNRKALVQCSPKASPGTTQTPVSFSMRKARSEPSTWGGKSGKAKKAPPGL